MSKSAEKRVCVVTGASSGIGAATALWFAQRDHHVVINYVHKAEAAQTVAEQCRSAGAEVLVVRADIAEDAQCRALADEVGQRWGGVHTLVNNAGIAPKFSDIKDLEALSAEDFMNAWRVNVVGTYQMCRAVAPLMAGRTNTSIVNISSMASVLGTGSSIAYAASKGGLNTLTLALARSLGPAIRVNAVLPGMVNSEWLRKGLGIERFEAGRRRYESRALLNAVIEGDEVASTAFWLALHATKLTGQLIQLDAGFMLG
jgi:NAD(P)-dependent dehydrogenase (short-subunit alcohol dehydrogenase family)